MQTVFHYDDYRVFLREYYVEQKANHAFFSYRYLGLKWEMDPGTLQRIFQGKAHLSSTSLIRVRAFLDLDAKADEYFENLFLFNKARSEAEAAQYYAQLLKLKDLRLHTLSELQYQYFSAWYHVPLRGLLGMGGFRNDYARLARALSPAITAEQAEQSVRLLEALHLISRNADGDWELTEAAVSTGSSWTSYAIRKYQHDAIGMAQASLERHPKEQRDVSSVTLAIRSEDLDRYRQRCAEFRQELMKMAVGTAHPDSVYQINLQFFPMGFLHGQDV